MTQRKENDTEPNSITIEVRPDNALSKNGLRRTGWFVLRKLIASARVDAFVLARIAAEGSRSLPWSPVSIEVVQYHARRPMDFDGLACAVAPSIDGMVDAGILIDDDPGHVKEYTLRHVKVARVVDSRVTITISPFSE